MWLCIDQGGHSTRAAVFDTGGELVAEESAALGTVTRKPYFVEHDPDDLLRSVDACIHGVAHQLADKVPDLLGVALATQRSTLLCAARRTGEALTPLISWQDRRGQDDLARFEGSGALIRSITGLRLSPHYGVGKLRWCLQHLDAVQRHRQQHDLVGAPLSSYLLHHLSGGRGQWKVDPVNASRTLLMDMHTASWSTKLLSLFELPSEMMPTIRPCRSDFGAVAIDGRAVPLTIATGDQAAALYCEGEPTPGRAFVNIGTGAFIQVSTGDRPVLDERLLSSIVWQDERQTQYALEGTVNGAASAVDEVSATLGRKLDPQSPELLQALERIEQAPLFLNGVSGLGSPDWAADFASRFEGDGDDAGRLAAVYESVVFLIVRNLQRMRRHLRLSGVTLSGGMARMDWLAQRLANLSGLQVTRPTETEATLMGLAYLASGVVRRATSSRRFEPVADRVAGERYARWTSFMDAELGR